ncbi:hypothetical protein [Paraburkholderia sp. 2C]
MKSTSLRDQFLDVLDKSGFNNMVRDRALAAWLILEAILAEHQCTAETLKTIEAEYLSSLASRFSKTDVETRLIELAAIRVILLHAGHTAASIQGLQVRVRRRRIENTPGGKYRYVKVLDDRIR